MENEAVFTQYRHHQILTASPDRLVLMLYEGALKATRDCQTALLAKDLTAATTAGRKLQEIMIGLTDILNPDMPESQTLRDLYLYAWRQAVAAQVQADPTALDGVVVVLQNLSAGLKTYLRHESSTSKTPAEPQPVGAGSINFAG
jgi:flagellar protein FliS